MSASIGEILAAAAPTIGVLLAGTGAFVAIGSFSGKRKRAMQAHANEVTQRVDVPDPLRGIVRRSAFADLQGRDLS